MSARAIVEQLSREMLRLERLNEEALRPYIEALRQADIDPASRELLDEFAALIEHGDASTGMALARFR